MKIYIDAGHGGIDPGAVGKNGAFEKNIVLEVAKRLQKELESKGFNQILQTRLIDVFVPLRQRATNSNKFGADLFVSIHCNAGAKGNRTAHGTETFYWHVSKRKVNLKQNMAFAHSIQNELIKTFPQFRNRGIKPSQTFTVLRRTNCNAILVELNFISNPDMERFMQTELFLRDSAKAISNGISEYALKGG